MGYTSDVVLAVALYNENANRLLAAYMIDPGVQEHGCMGHWRRATYEAVTILWVKFDYVKWYEDYGYVQAFEHMRDLCEQMNEACETFTAASLKIRIGEDDDDIERDVREHGSDLCELREALETRFGLMRKIYVDVDGEPIDMSGS